MKHSLFCRRAIVIGFLCSLSLGAMAQDHKTYIPETDPLALQKLDTWQDLKFGLFMHWGIYSQWGIVESWALCSEDEDWCRRENIENYEDFKKAYNNLKLSFNPQNFQPKRWADAAKAAGMKYMIFTTKHHDGFAMFDTQLSNFKVTDPLSPFSSDPRADISKEVFNTFRDQNFMVGAYFSKPDWHSNDYWWERFATPDRHVNYNIARYPDKWENFVQFTQGQINELMSDYGPIDILWLDGGWVRTVSDEEIENAKRNGRKRQSQDIRMHEIAQNARAKQPGILIVDREVPGPHQNYLTPENQVPNQALPYPWETCMTMATSWSYVPRDVYKSTRDLVHLLADIVSKGGNLLLNIGPGPDGDWDPVAYQRLEGMGRWMDVNSDAIYGTRAHSQFRDEKFVFTKKKDSNTLYAIYLAEDNESMPATLSLNNIRPAQGSKIKLLGYSGNIPWQLQADGKLLLRLPAAARAAKLPQEAWVFSLSL